MPYTPLTDVQKRDVNNLSPALTKINLGTWLKGLAEVVFVRGQASHDYAGAATDWILSAVEQRASTLIAANANAACAIVAPATAGARYVVRNTSGQALTIKKSGGTGVTIASAKTAIVEYIGSDYVRVTADA